MVLAIALVVVYTSLMETSKWTSHLGVIKNDAASTAILVPGIESRSSILIIRICASFSNLCI